MLKKIYFSFPVQLLLYHLRSNHILILLWLLLFLTVTGNFGRVLGIPNLFLDPEYLGAVNFWSFLILGISIAGFTTAYNITGYIIDSRLFSFLGAVSRPFAKYSLNNSLIPLSFLIVYIIRIIQFQTTNEFTSTLGLIGMIAGLLTGFILMMALFIIYFKFTNKDIFQIIASNVERRLKSVPMARGNVLNRYKSEITAEIRVDNYLELNLKSRNIRENPVIFRKEAILKVFGQNHLNLVILELLSFASLLALGLFKDYPLFQIPAAASAILLFTVIMMFTGAVAYWVRKWSLTTVIVLFLIINYMIGHEILSSEYQAFGIDYSVGESDYSLKSLNELTIPNYKKDINSTIDILENWKAKFPEEEKPKMVLICTSGGGQRAALWTVNALQKADSATHGNLLEHSVLITGASGGMIGAGYMRELMLRKKLGEDVDLYADDHLKRISSDNLNPIIFSLLVNDLFFRYQPFEYNGMTYFKDRGYAFEQQLNKNTLGVMDKPLKEYYTPEREAVIPLMFIAPTIINDSRKLYISPQPVAYMNMADSSFQSRLNQKIKGIEFSRFFEEQGAEDLRFLSALRMGATFPYVSPNVSLPSNPRMQIMDAGISDMFGISDATRFMYVFRDWINENTSGVILVSIRDSEKIRLVQENVGESLIHKLTNPVTRLYTNIGSTHDIRNDNHLEFAASWLEGHLELVELEYISGPSKRAALNWRLTTREKQDIISNIENVNNQKSIKKLQQLLQ